MNSDRNLFPDYDLARGNQNPDGIPRSHFPMEDNFPDKGGDRGGGGVSDGSGEFRIPLPVVPFLSETQLEAMRQRQEARWNAIEDEIAWCWDWKKVAAGWEQLVSLDRQFFPQRFREYVAEVLNSARYIPPHALEVVLGYCLRQPPPVQKMYADLWKEKLKTEKWANWQQQMVIEEYLTQYHLRQKQDYLPHTKPDTGTEGKTGLREWWEKIRPEREGGTLEKISCPARHDVEIQELPED